MLKNEDEISRIFAQDRMNELKGLSVSDRYVIPLDGTRAVIGSKNVMTKAELQYLLQSGGDVTKARIQKLTKSSNPDDRHYATELLLPASREGGVSFLMDLWNDSYPKERNQPEE